MTKQINIPQNRPVPFDEPKRNRGRLGDWAIAVAAFVTFTLLLAVLLGGLALAAVKIWVEVLSTI